MSTSETLPTTYHGYTIDKETDPWEIKRGNILRVYQGEFTGEPGTYAHADDLEDAKEYVRGELDIEEPSSPLSISGDAAPLNILLFAMYDYDKKVNKIRIEAPGLDLEQHHKHIKEVMAVVAQALKDAEFERTVGETKD